MLTTLLNLLSWIFAAGAIALAAWFDWRVVAAVGLWFASGSVRYYAAVRRMTPIRQLPYTETPPRRRKRLWPRS